MPRRLVLVDCDIAFARYPALSRSLSQPSADVAIPIFHPTPIGPVSFRFFVSAFTHSIPHIGIRRGSRVSGYTNITIYPWCLLHILSPFQFRDLGIWEILNSWTPEILRVWRDISRKLHIEIIHVTTKYRERYLRNAKSSYGANYFKLARMLLKPREKNARYLASTSQVSVSLKGSVRQEYFSRSTPRESIW